MKIHITVENETVREDYFIEVKHKLRANAIFDTVCLALDSLEKIVKKAKGTFKKN